MIVPNRVRVTTAPTLSEALLIALMVFLLFGLAVVPSPSQAALTGPIVKPPTIGEKIAASKDLLDINTATAAQLRALPGMGDQYVVRVIAGRPYTAKNQLTMRGILPQAAYEAIKDQIIAHRPAK